MLGIGALAADAQAADAQAADVAPTAADPGGGSGTASGGGTPRIGPIIAAPSVLPATGIPASGLVATGLGETDHIETDHIATGPDVRVGDLGAPFGRLPANHAPAARAWSLVPAIGVTEEYATGGGGASNQFITTLQPSLAISSDTARLHGDLSYAPQVALYSRDGRQNQVDQDFEGRLLATLLPGLLFLDLRGAGAVQAVSAGQVPDQLSTLNRADTTQTYSFSATPYAVHRFGSWGTGEVGGTLARTTQSARQTPQRLGPSTSGPLLAALADASNQNVTTTSGHVAFTTGEAFARYSGAALAQATNFDGSGVLRGAYRDIATLDHGYAWTRTITALATTGWERIHYAGSTPVDIDDAIWNVGLRLAPSAYSSVTVRYGHRDGLNSLTVDAAAQPTARTRLYARYSTGLTTQAEQLQNALATSDLDPQGNPVDHATGAPLVAAGTFFGVQNSLFKTTLASLTGVLLLDRDSLSLSLSSQIQTLVSASSRTAANGDSRGLYGSFTWSHALRPNLQGTLSAQYGIQNGGGASPGGVAAARAGEQRLVVATAALSYALTPTLSGQAQYSYRQVAGAQRFASQATGGQSLLLLSLIKSF